MAKKIFKTGSGKTTYPSDVTDEEWAFCAPYLTLMKEEAPQREHSPRTVFNAVRYMVRAGCPWRMIPNDLAPWSIVFQQAQRWIAAGCFGSHGARSAQAGADAGAGHDWSGEGFALYLNGKLASEAKSGYYKSGQAVRGACFERPAPGVCQRQDYTCL